jgi:hypothetical protein
MLTSPIIPQLAESSLQDISNQRGLKFEKRRPSKETMVEALSEDIASQGIKAFVQVLKTADLQALSAKVPDKDLLKKGNNPAAKTVLSKRVAEALNKKGIIKYLTSLKPSEKLLTTILERLGVEATSKKTSEMIVQIETEIHYIGLSAIFSNCSSKQLQAFAKDMGLTVESTAKTVLLRCILASKSYTAEDKPKIARKPKEKKEKKEEVDEDGDVDMEDPVIRGPPPKFDWVASEDDSEDFEAATGPDAEDEEMSDVASENDEPEEQEEDEEDPEDGEYEDE